VVGGLAEWVIELVPTFDVRIGTVHTSTGVSARVISLSPFRSTVTKETVLRGEQSISRVSHGGVAERRHGELDTYNFVQSPC